MPGLGGRKEAEVWGRGCLAFPTLPQGTEPSTLEVLPQHFSSHKKKGRYREKDPRLFRTKARLVDGFILKSSPLFLVRNKEKESRMQRWTVPR